MLVSPRGWGILFGLQMFVLVGFAWFTALNMPGPQYANLISLSGFAVGANWARVAFRKWRGTENAR